MRKKVAKIIGSLLMISMILTAIYPAAVFAAEEETTVVSSTVEFPELTAEEEKETVLAEDPSAAEESLIVGEQIATEVAEADQEETADEVPPAPAEDPQQEEAEQEIDLGGSTEVVDNTTTLEDGSYTPDAFTFSGGSGRITIECLQVTVKEGRSFATISISSVNYGYVKASGGKYYPNVTDSTTEFTIPIQLNQDNTIIGMTTAMSEPCEIQYIIRADLTGNGGEPDDEKELAKAFVYTGSGLNIIKEDGSAAASFAPQEGTKAVLSGNNVKIVFLPSDQTTYSGFYLDADISEKETWKTLLNAETDGSYSITLEKSFCGFAWPIAPVKTDGETTTEEQYYLAIPAEDQLEQEEKPEQQDGKIDLTITNNHNMFKAVTAYLETKDGKTELVVALSGTGYAYLVLGTYEEVAAKGDDRADWIPAFEDENGKYAYRIPIEDEKTHYPVVTISNTYLENYEKGKNPLERAFFPRQLEIDLTEKTLVTGDYETEQALELTNNVKMFKPLEAALKIVGGPNSNNYAKDLVLTMGTDSFDGVFVGTAEEAAKAGSTISINDRKAVFSVIGKTAGEAFITSWHSVAKDAWYERKFTVNEKDGTLVIDEVTEEDKEKKEEKKDDESKPEEEKKEEDPLNGGTAAVDNSTTLADGVYTPDSFSFSGGTGRVNITCPQVTIKNGQAYATIVFNSSKYGYVKASGGTYYPTVTNGTSVFSIPVQLNQNNTIIGMTTAMSAAHEITYSIFVYIAAAEGKEAGDSVKNDSIGEENQLDETAPSIMGLSDGEEIQLEHAKFLKLFRYDGGITLVEIDRTTGTILDPEQLAKDTADGTQNDSDSKQTAVEINEEESLQEDIKTDADYRMDLYQEDVVKYLIVPENVELPAGLDKKAIIIRLPKKSVYVSSDDAADTLESLDLLDLIKTTGTTEETCKIETLKTALKEKTVVSVGTMDDLNYTELVKAKTDLVISIGEDLIPKEAAKDKKTADYQDQYTKVSERMALLDIPMLIVRAADEKDPLGSLEWLKLFGILFDKEAEADALIKKGVQ